jgi:hypothetical protein
MVVNFIDGRKWEFVGKTTGVMQVGQTLSGIGLYPLYITVG